MFPLDNVTINDVSKSDKAGAVTVYLIEVDPHIDIGYVNIAELPEGKHGSAGSYDSEPSSAHVVMHDVTHTSSWPTHTDRLHPAHRASRPRPRSEDPDVCEAGCDTRVTRGAGVLATPSYQPQNFSGVSRTLPQATTISLPIVSQKRHTLATLIVRNQG